MSIKAVHIEPSARESDSGADHSVRPGSCLDSSDGRLGAVSRVSGSTWAAASLPTASIGAPTHQPGPSVRLVTYSRFVLWSIAMPPVSLLKGIDARLLAGVPGVDSGAAQLHHEHDAQAEDRDVGGLVQPEVHETGPPAAGNASGAWSCAFLGGTGHFGAGQTWPAAALCRSH
jgi:hypothetical protein